MGAKACSLFMLIVHGLLLFGRGVFVGMKIGEG